LTAASIHRRRGAFAAAAFVILAGTAVTAVLQLVPLNAVQTWARDSGQPLLVNSVGRSDGSSSQRGTLIEESIDLYANDSLLGSGPGTTKQLLSERQYPYAKEAHNDYLATLVERGPLGALGIVALVFSAGFRASVVVRTSVHSPPFADLPRPEALVATLATLAVAGTFYEVMHFRFLWILLALTAVLAEAAASPERRRGGAS